MKKLFLFALAIAFSFTSAFAAEAISVQKFKETPDGNGFYQVKAYITYINKCPPCPPENEGLCSPCPPDGFVISDIAGKTDCDVSMPECLSTESSDPDIIASGEVGKQYIFTVSSGGTIRRGYIKKVESAK